MRRSRMVWTLLLLPVTVIVLEGGSCGGDETDNPLAVGDEFRASVTLVAHDGINGGIAVGECIHLFAPGEDFPCCQVCRPQDVGRVFRQTFMNVKRGDSYTFRAGRNGVELGVKTCTVSTRDVNFLEVVWFGPLMECGAGFEVE
ncbi:MAG TPA: hypothetical protein VFH82_00495 [Gemmatimonadota bacterium]|nr:hypothetical protein [Gemmatimonadota bacterium]